MMRNDSQQPPPKKPPTKRLFKGVAGSPLSTIAAEPVPKQRMILLHYCFDQERGELKQPTCTCKHRVPLDQAMEYVTEKRADWLLSKHPKTGNPVRSGRAIVIRRVVIDGEILFGVPNPKPKIEPWNLKQHNRDQKHAAIKAGVFGESRNLLRKWVAAGVIPQTLVDVSDGELESLLNNERESQEFLNTLSPGKQKQWLARMTHYWNNILGYAKLNMDAGEFMKDADHGTGITVSLGSSEHVELIEGRHGTDSGRVMAANFVPRKLNGKFIYNHGAAPDEFDRDPELNELATTPVDDVPVVDTEPEIPDD